MNINSTLKKEGIKIIDSLNALDINKIATTISNTMAEVFPEHHICQSDLFIAIARLNMYIAEMPNDMAIAKYFYKNNSIYFSKNLNFDGLNTVVFHECIHYMQELKNQNGKLLRMGLYDLENGTPVGMGLNEAAVQHMASVATGAVLDNVKYYNMELSTESPDYYPLQTALLNELIYFTGSYPLYHSTLYSNDIFKNTFIAKSSPKTYYEICKNFDLIMEYETRLSKEIYKLSIASEDFKNLNKIKRINSKIDDYKKIILETTLETQNKIILDCFNNEFSYIRTLEDVKSFQYKLYNFKHVLINTNGYNFFNEFYIDMMNRLEEKKEYILKNGNIKGLDFSNTELANIESKTYGFQFFKTLFDKLKLLVEEKIRQKNY